MGLIIDNLYIHNPIHALDKISDPLSSLWDILKSIVTKFNVFPILLISYGWENLQNPHPDGNQSTPIASVILVTLDEGIRKNTDNFHISIRNGVSARLHLNFSCDVMPIRKEAKNTDAANEGGS
ncbi:hypothetical protein AVEN_123146-1 [Araneus ventricosus]|uniref:Uncharacterized protein n=1 Tax=Araneus ventricosus TaxID=182803 RepID=A0A4Y2WFM0_ARAVE|nr:hypothetical protein AVEN_123146-1 [Araneus ventricosus]